MAILYIVAGWFGISIVVSLLLGRFIVAGRGGSPSWAGEDEAVRIPENVGSPNTIGTDAQNHRSREAA